MLVLNRRIDEEIVFPDLDITVKVLGVQGNKISIGIQAPPSVQVLRQEIVERMEKESSGATRVPPLKVTTPLIDKPLNTRIPIRHDFERSATCSRSNLLLFEPEIDNALNDDHDPDIIPFPQGECFGSGV